MHITQRSLCQNCVDNFENHDSVSKGGFACTSGDQSKTWCQNNFQKVNHILLAELTYGRKCEAIVFYEWNAVAHNALQRMASKYCLACYTLSNIYSKIHAVPYVESFVLWNLQHLYYEFPVFTLLDNHTRRVYLETTRQQESVNVFLYVVSLIQHFVQMFKSRMVFWMCRKKLCFRSHRPLYREFAYVAVSK